MKQTPALVVIALALAFAGCKKGGASAPDCGKAIDHSMELSKGEMAKMPGVDDKMLAKMRDLGLQHCKDDKWSAEARRCMVDAKTMTDSQACYGKLTKEQQDGMNAAAMALAPDAPPTHVDTTVGSAGSAGSAAAPATDMGAGSAGSAAPK